MVAPPTLNGRLPLPQVFAFKSYLPLYSSSLQIPFFSSPQLFLAPNKFPSSEVTTLRFTVRSHCSPPASMEPRKFNGKWDCHASSSSEGLLANSTPCQWEWATCSFGSAVATLLAIELSSSQLAKRGAITVTTYHVQFWIFKSRQQIFF
ncbi:unnamed protein product [Microthlaspi erraticum]|uniref:Uncharacterized protein n=1 Tax=Microthlaspi erraticum TaxID=1685480 RepID=A0A6D2INV7_9BRAS|nr:unnamed protein product [Microthlaspi erraticum]